MDIQVRSVDIVVGIKYVGKEHKEGRKEGLG